MVVLKSTGTSHYHNCCIDGGTSPEYFGSHLEQCVCARAWVRAWGGDNKVCELTTMCLLWQHWTKALVWFDDTDISAFHSCVFVDLWQPLSEWHLLLYACFGVSPRECRSL